MLRSTLYTGRFIDAEWRQKCEVDIFDEESDDVDGMNWILDNPPARRVVEKALLDGTSARHCANIVTMKFGRAISERAASLYRRCYWDTEALTKIDFAHYYARGGQRKPDPPPPSVPLEARGAFTAWEEGIVPDEEELSTEKIMRTIQVDAFMCFEKARAKPTPEAQDDARKWAVLAMRASQFRKPKASSKGQEQLPGLKPAVYYPEFNTPTLADLEDAGDGNDDDSNDDPI